MSNNVYIGSRYLPLFDGAWSPIKSYEALIIVEYGNNSYTSKRPVPVNTPPTTGDENDPYWGLSGNYNGQISNLQNQINTLVNTTIPGINSEIENLTDDVLYDAAPNEGMAYYGSLTDMNPQGMCADDYGRIYIATPVTSLNCDITVANFTGGVIEQHSNVPIYHANDMTFCNGLLYVASCHEQSGFNNNKKIVIVNPVTWATSEINPFAAESSTAIFGITTYDNTHLICALTTGQSISDVHIYMLNLNDNSYVELPIRNPKNIHLDYSLLQSIQYSDGKLYLLTTAPNYLIEFNISDYADITHLISLRSTFNNGMPVGETEAVALLPANLGGMLLIESRTQDRYYDALFGLYDPHGNTPYSYYADDVLVNALAPHDVYVDSSYALIKEIGTQDYPYKRILNAAYLANTPNNGLMKCTGQLRVKGGTYRLPSKVFNLKLNMISYSNSDIVTITDAVNFEHCEVFLNGRAGDPKQFVLSGEVVLVNTRATFVNCQVAKTTASSGSIFLGSSLYTTNEVVFTASVGTFQLGGTSYSGTLLTVANGSVVKMSGLGTSSVTLTADSTLITNGTK